MDNLKRNQILLEISEDKTKCSVSCGVHSRVMTFDTTPEHVTEYLQNSLNAFIKETMLDAYPEWCNE